MTERHVRRTLQLLLVAVLAEAAVALVLRGRGARGLVDGDGSWINVVALVGLASVALLIVVTLRATRELVGLADRVADADSRIADLEAAARAVGVGRQPQLPADFGRDVTLARQRLVDVLHRGNLAVALQPIVDLERDRFVAAEALARFPDGRGPEAWFRDAQEMSLGVELELLAVDRALAAARQLPPDIRVSINASPSLILDPRLAETLTGSGVTLERLAIEITEHAAVTEYDEIRSALLSLRERGVQLAVDDTGAGYASFNHVFRLRPDIIKLDRSMVVGIADDPARRAFVTAIVLLALELDATVTAEGVESEAELQAVAALGVDHAQGFHIARPDTSPAVWRSWSQRRWLAAPGGSALRPDEQEATTRPALEI